MSPSKRNRNKGAANRPQARRPSGRRTVTPPPVGGRRPATGPQPAEDADSVEQVDGVVQDGSVEDVDGDQITGEPDADMTAEDDSSVENTATDEGDSEDGDDGEDIHDLAEPDEAATEFWEQVGIDPVLLSLPRTVGLTLRCYVPAEDEDDDQVDTGDGEDGTDEQDDDVEDPTDEDDDLADETTDEDAEDAEPTDEDAEAAEPTDEDAEPTDEDDEPEDAGQVQHPDTVPHVAFHRSGRVEGEADRVEPRFLGRDGTIFLFRSLPELVAFVRSDAEHDLSDAPGWEQVRTAEELDPTPELLNRYELDLVVDIARGGGDAWGETEKQTLLLAGEIARDAAAYCELPDVQAMLAPGTPLDALDDDLRRGGFLAKRRLRRYNADQIALSWRRIIRELSLRTEVRD